MADPKIYLRPLKPEDALVSYQWRNDPDIWRFTGLQPDRVITPEIETEWIGRVLARENEYRFAICIADTGTYIVNVQLTSVTPEGAEFHIFIGAKQYWDGGFGTEATQKMVRHAFGTMHIPLIYLYVRRENLRAIKAYQRAGFTETVGSDRDGFIKMTIKRT